MTLGKTVEDILRKAIRDETESYEIYIRAVHLVQDRRVKERLHQAAQEELKHKAALERLLANPDQLRVGLRRLGQGAIEDNQVGDQVGFMALRPDATFRDVCLFARRNEQQAYESYRGMAEQNEGEIRALFEAMAQEELGHERMFQRWYEEAMDLDS